MTLPVELSLALRYLRPRRTFVSVITVLSILGVTLGVGALIVVLSVMAGFQQRLQEEIIGFNADITVAMADGNVLYDYEKLVDLIRKQPDVLAASPIIRGPVLVEHNGEMTPAIIKSVPETGDDPVLPLKKYLIMGDWELRGDSVLVGREWSRRNGAFPGDKLTIYGAAQVQSYLHRTEKNASIALPSEPIIRGVFETGKYDYDLNFLLVSTELAQEIWGMRDAVHGIAVRVKDPGAAEQVKDELNKGAAADAARADVDGRQPGPVQPDRRGAGGDGVHSVPDAGGGGVRAVQHADHDGDPEVARDRADEGAGRERRAGVQRVPGARRRGGGDRLGAGDGAGAAVPA